MPSGQRAGIRGALLLGLGAAALSVGVGTVSAEGSAYVIADVQCNPAGGGVLDLTLINERPTLEAEFVVDGPSGQSAHTVAVGSAAAVTYTGLSDGVVSVGVTIDGVPSSVTATVACSATAAVPSVEASPASGGQAASGLDALPRTGSSTGGLLIGGALVACGVAASLVARRRYS